MATPSQDHPDQPSGSKSPTDLFDNLSPQDAYKLERAGLMEMVQKLLHDSGNEQLLSSGIVLTGGSSVMQGMVELGEEIFHMPVRMGVPRYSGGLADVVRNPRYATAVGLLLEGVSQVQQGRMQRQDGSLRAVLARMREWFQRNF